MHRIELPRRNRPFRIGMGQMQPARHRTRKAADGIVTFKRRIGQRRRRRLCQQISDQGKARRLIRLPARTSDAPCHRFGPRRHFGPEPLHQRHPLGQRHLPPRGFTAARAAASFAAISDALA